MKICIFCGSSSGLNPVYKTKTIEAAKILAARNVDLVYGGAKIGLMGTIADSMLQQGQHVTGVIPHLLKASELAHENLTKLITVHSMHERKTKMAELSDAFLALPGGVGTLEEIFEQWTWLQLGIHQKPCAFLNMNGYFDPIKEMVSQMISNNFLKKEHGQAILFHESISDILDYFENFQPPDKKYKDQDDGLKP